MALLKEADLSKNWTGISVPRFNEQCDNFLRIIFCCCCSFAKSCPTLCDPIYCNTPPFLVLHCILEFAQTHVHWISNVIQPSCPLPLFFPSVFPSIRVFANEPALHIGWPKYWSFRTSPFNDDSGLISFRMDWLDLLAVQGTLRSLLQHHSLEASFLQCLLWVSQVACGKEPACQCKRYKRLGFNTWVRRSPGEGHSNPLWYSCLENPMDRGAWWAAVHRVVQSRIRLKWLSTQPSL